MSTKEAVHTLRDDKQDLQKQLGCMNGIFQIFDRRYLLGQRRHGHNQKRLPPGQSNNGEKDLKNVKEKEVKKEMKRVSVELPRKSFSSSSSSTAMSSLDYSKRVQTQVSSSSSQSLISESSSTPFVHRKQAQSPDIRDLVKDAMTREPRVVSIKTMAKDARLGPAMKHVDSPRPFPVQIPYRFDRNVRETARFSCDGRYQLKPNMKIKELPRLSLDSRQRYISNSANESPISNYKRPSSSSVVARLMGLEALTDTIDIKTNTCCLNQESVLNSTRKDENLNHECTFVSPKVQKPQQRGVKVSHVITRIPLEMAPWKQQGFGRASQKPLFKIKEGKPQGEPASRSIYDEIEKRLTGHEYRTAGKDLRALKRILEAMQKTKKRLENKQHVLVDDRLILKVDQPVSPTVSQRKFKHADTRKDSVGRNGLRDRTPTGRPLSNSNFPQHSTTVSPRLQRSKNSVSIQGPSSDWIKPKKQPGPGMQRTILGSMNRNPKAKSMDSLQDSSETRNMSQQSDSVSFKSENDSEVTSNEWAHEVNSPFRPKENHRTEMSTVEHVKQTMDQPSPVSVLDAFYTEETPSPVKKKSNAFNDVDNLHFEEAQDQSKMNKLPNSISVDRYSDFNTMKLVNVKKLVHQIELLNTNTDTAADAAVNHTLKSSCEDEETEDHRYVKEIILASGCLNDLDSIAMIVELHPTVDLINPGLFHVLEKTKTCTDDEYKKTHFMRSNIGRKLVFDTVNDVLGHTLAMRKRRILNGDKLLKELIYGIDSLQNKLDTCGYDEDEDDEVTNIINADVNKRSQDWDEYCNQVPGLVLDIERLIFKDLISEVVSLQDWSVRPHCRQLFTM